LALALDNQGTVTLNRPLTINRAGAAHANSGTIDVSGGDLTLNPIGHRTKLHDGGNDHYRVGSNVRRERRRVQLHVWHHQRGTLSVSGTAVASAQPFNTATAALTLINSTWDGSGTITVSGATALDVRASTITAPLVNQATIRATGSSAFNGGLVNPAGSTLTVQGNGTYGLATFTVGTSFTNGGAIVLTIPHPLTGPRSPCRGRRSPMLRRDHSRGHRLCRARTLALTLDNQGYGDARSPADAEPGLPRTISTAARSTSAVVTSR